MATMRDGELQLDHCTDCGISEVTAELLEQVEDDGSVVHRCVPCGHADEQEALSTRPEDR